MTMSIPPQDEPLTNRPLVSFMTETPKNPCGIMRGPASMTTKSLEDPWDFAYDGQAISLLKNVPSSPEPSSYRAQNQVQRLKLLLIMISHIDEAGGKSQTGKPEEEEQDEKDNPENINSNPSSPPDLSVSFTIEKNDDSHKEEPEVGKNVVVGELEVEYFEYSRPGVIFDKKKLGSSLEVSLDDSWRTI
ncbi:hypothetical protein Tco_0998421 [Tanacetum coccineum]